MLVLRINDRFPTWILLDFLYIYIAGENKLFLLTAHNIMDIREFLLYN